MHNAVIVAMIVGAQRPAPPCRTWRNVLHDFAKIVIFHIVAFFDFIVGETRFAFVAHACFGHVQIIALIIFSTFATSSGTSTPTLS